MQHFVVDNVFKEPGRNKRSIQSWMYPNDFVFLLNRAEDEIFFGGMFPFAAPGDCVALERTAEVFGIHFLEQRFQVKVLTLVQKLELPLTRKPFNRDFSLSLSHKKVP